MLFGLLLGLTFTCMVSAQPYEISCQQMMDGEELPGEYIITLEEEEPDCDDADIMVGFRITINQIGGPWKGLYFDHKQSNLLKPVVDNIGAQASFTTFVPVADVLAYDLTIWDSDTGLGPDQYMLYRLNDTATCFKPGLIYNFRYQNAVRCCEEIEGLCFDDNPPFDHLPLPECPDDIEIRQMVFTKANPEGQVVTRTTIPPAWNENLRTVVIVHGWLGSDDDRWMENMKDIFLEHHDYNVITTSWEESSQQLYYPGSASDTRSVGAHIAAVYDNLIQNGGGDPADFYCTGHSLGSHICGHSGAYSQSLFNTTISRITGMDPAGPLFEGKFWTVGLNPSCAEFVDIMHTHGIENNVLNLGTMKILGHVDFFPNGGDTQPGCVLDPLDDMTPACSHMRAIRYYMESIAEDCLLSRQLCDDQWDLPASCENFTDPLQAMGLGSDGEGYMDSGIFYLETNDEEPYCLYYD